MSRYWAVLPLLVTMGVPILSSPSDLVIAIELVAGLLGTAGILWSALSLITGGGVIATIGYAVAVGDGTVGADVVGATAFGLALLFLLDLSEFARRQRGAAISGAALRGQVTYWLARTAITLGVVGGLLLGATILALVIPGRAIAVVAGAGAIIGFAGALRTGIGRPDP